jgi:hypothetical protein
MGDALSMFRRKRPTTKPSELRLGPFVAGLAFAPARQIVFRPEARDLPRFTRECTSLYLADMQRHNGEILGTMLCNCSG